MRVLNRTSPWTVLWSGLLVFVAAILLYALSDAPVVRLTGKTSDDLAAFQTADRLLDNAWASGPLLKWAELWGVR